MRRFRDWLGMASTIVSAFVEHWLGETVAVAVLTAVVVIGGGILWRRVSMLMSSPRPGNCTKSYAVDKRLTDYINLMAPLSPIVTANKFATANASFLAGLSRLPHQTTSNGSITVSTPGGANAAWYSNVESVVDGVVNAVNTLQVNLQAGKFES
jgi:hypothetical protein